MAEVEEIPCSVKTQRNRKPNFSVAEEEMLQHEVGKHFEILNRKFCHSALCIVKALFAFEVVFLHLSRTSLAVLMATPKALILSVILAQMVFFWQMFYR
jgi:hypothetical protein